MVEGIYKERYSKRAFDEVREMEAKVGVVPSADGSGFFRTGKTKAIAAVRGPRTLHPQHMQNSQKGVLRVSYGMMPFSVEDRIRPGPNRRAEEIGKVTEWALSSVLDLSGFPNTVVDVFIQIPQADAGTRVAGINAAALALAHAGLPMKEMVSAIGVGKIDKTLVVDLDKYEDSLFHDAEGSTDIPIVLTSRKKEIGLLQLDGKISVQEFKDVIEMGKKACEDILKVQMDALKNGGEANE